MPLRLKVGAPPQRKVLDRIGTMVRLHSEQIVLQTDRLSRLRVEGLQAMAEGAARQHGW